MATASKCPICGSQAAFAFQAKHVPVSRCQNEICGHLFAAVTSAKQGVEEHPRIPDEHVGFAERNVRLVKYLERVGVLHPESRVLDFGSGAGHVAAAVQQVVGSSNITCVEADDRTAAVSRSRGLDTATALEDVRGDFDTILAIEVIEHLDDPVAILRDLVALARPAGALFLTTPCGETRRGAHPANAYEMPAHVQFFTERSLQLAARFAGCDGIKLRVINAMYPHERGIRVTRSWIKATGRVARAVLSGPVHLTGIARLPADSERLTKAAVRAQDPAGSG